MEAVARLVICVEGGLVQAVLADRPVEVLVLDRDIEGAEDDELRTVEGDEVYAREEAPEVDADRVARMWKEAVQ